MGRRMKGIRGNVECRMRGRRERAGLMHSLEICPFTWRAHSRQSQRSMACMRDCPFCGCPRQRVGIGEVGSTTDGTDRHRSGSRNTDAFFLGSPVLSVPSVVHLLGLLMPTRASALQGGRVLPRIIRALWAICGSSSGIADADEGVGTPWRTRSSSDHPCSLGHLWFIFGAC
ncbi:hypothetical protein EI77_01289 [Prosthecobacter fusiformis]|uniref:Uncharacterized protein n=1 Tax=Prosthecobacter fusiformis TaxID=48464 RepID=A0A4R7S3H9_9BACT|nr:hypothetical protein EI77_01289 [Prosthecobacter fusiformis]